MNEELDEIETVAGDDLNAVRAVVLSAYPDCVPELVQGETVQALLASIAPAREAFARIAATVTGERPALPVVPAGGGSPLFDPAELPAAEKLRRGIAGRNGPGN